MAVEKHFPVLRAGDVVKAFPDLRAGDVLKVHTDDFSNSDEFDAVDGQLVILHVDSFAGADISVTPTDGSWFSEFSDTAVAARVSEVDETTVTFEVISAGDEGAHP